MHRKLKKIIDMENKEKEEVKELTQDLGFVTRTYKKDLDFQTSSRLFVKISFYFYEINGITTKQDIEVCNNLQAILEGVERLMYNNNQYLFVRFYFMGSYYQVQNKNLKIKQL